MKVASDTRQLFDLMGIKGLGDVGPVGLQQRRGGRNVNFLGNIADLHGNVEPGDGIDLHRNRARDGLLKPGRFDKSLTLFAQGESGPVASLQMIGRMREPDPPRTRPRWRPCARVISSTMAFASP